jgi:hypothetical protein
VNAVSLGQFLPSRFGSGCAYESVTAVMRFENHVLFAGIENGLDVWFTTNNGSNSRWIIVDLWKETRKL